MSERGIGIKGWRRKGYHYSRANSVKFWQRVGAIKDPNTHHELYDKGCRLQNLEEQTLRALDEAEAAQKKVRRAHMSRGTR